MNRALYLCSFLNNCQFPISLTLTRYTIFILVLTLTFSLFCVHHCVGICISQDKLGYAVITNNLKISVVQNNKHLFILHTSCPCLVSQRYSAHLVSQMLWLMDQAPSWTWSVTTFEGKSPQARNVLRLISQNLWHEPVGPPGVSEVKFYQRIRRQRARNSWWPPALMINTAF